jgi:mRNA interferase MazF
LNAGDVLVGAFPGAATTKIRPAVVLSTEFYHRHRPDVIVGLITTQAPKELIPTDCELRDWTSSTVLLQVVPRDVAPT